MIVPIDNVMVAVFDAPVTTVGGQHALRAGLFRVSTGDAIGDFTAVFACFFICGFALDDKNFCEVRKVQIIVQFGSGPDFANFDAAVIQGVTLDKIRIFAVFKIKSNIFKKPRIGRDNSACSLGVNGLRKTIFGDWAVVL
ncbi:MAG: hypothetical protein JRJ04_00530 [Deltaproteobacteria bacterium]|nr:hypothetical protein [Deltaproteobacteria bacterium]